MKSKLSGNPTIMVPNYMFICIVYHVWQRLQNLALAGALFVDALCKSQACSYFVLAFLLTVKCGVWHLRHQPVLLTSFFSLAAA